MIEISFTSKIVPIVQNDFYKITSTFNRNSFVDFPWTIAESRIGKDVYTKRVCDCSTCLITNGSEAVLMHLDPSIIENHVFSKVLIFLRNNIDLNDKNLQAVLIGSKNTKSSQDIWKKFVNLMDYLNIPTSIFKNGKSPTNIAYRTRTDEILISNNHIEKFLKTKTNSREVLENSFGKIKIASCDEI